MLGAMTRAAEQWRAIRFTGFERRQIAAVRSGLDVEYTAADTTPPLSPVAASASQTGRPHWL